MFESSPSPSLPAVISVSDLNRIARDLIERSLPLTWVAGEISNCKRYGSGHCYFTLKDAQAQVDCVMFRGRAQLLGWQPQDGMKVEVRALPTLYEARGRFQLNVEVMRRAFDATVNDPVLREEALKLGLVVTHKTGEQIHDLIVDASKTPPEIIARASEYGQRAKR